MLKGSAVMRKWKLLLILAILSSLFAFSVYADTTEVEHDGYILRFKDEAAKEAAMLYLEATGNLCGEEIPVSEVYEPENLYKIDSKEYAKYFDELGLLEYYEPDAICYLFDYDYSLDPGYTSYQLNWAHACSNAPGAWKYGVYGNDVKVAVIDSGALTTHEDLKDNIITGYGLVDYDGNGSISETEAANYVDTLGHGTAVSGVIAAAANGKGVVGTAHRAKIIPIKITDAGSFAVSKLSTAVFKAIELDADVINLSLGTTSNNTSFKTALDTAIKKGIIVVSASGNTSSYSQYSTVYPGSYDNIISVGNLKKESTNNFQISSSSIQNAGVTIAAPGTSIRSSYYRSNSDYASVSGTSFACPYVSGIAALAKSVDPGITQTEFMEILIRTAKKDVLNGEERTNAYGYGIADAGAVIEELIKRRNAGGFVSPIDKTVSNGTNVKVCNPLTTPQTYSFIAKVYNVDRPISFAYKPLTLNPGEVVEIPLAALSGAESSNISCYLLDPTKLRPLYKKIDN